MMKVSTEPLDVVHVKDVLQLGASLIPARPYNGSWSVLSLVESELVLPINDEGLHRTMT
jgi:hypothetical protein